MEILIVGAGAVGQTFGRALHRGGARVSWFVKPRYAEEARRGFALHAVGLFRPVGRAPVERLDGLDVLTTLDEVAARRWDQVWCTVSSPALRGGWLVPMAAATGDATFVALQPGLDDRPLLEAAFGGERLVRGLITAIAWQAPLPGERTGTPGVAWWFPPGGAVPFAGPRAEAVVQALRRGGCTARASEAQLAKVPFLNGTMMMHLAGLEVEGWSLSRYRTSDTLGLAGQATAEALAVARHRSGTDLPGIGLFTGRRIPALLFRILPMLAPFPLEAYLRVHFTKVGDQTRMYLDQYALRAQEAGLPSTSIRALTQALDAARGAPPTPQAASSAASSETSAQSA